MSDNMVSETGNYFIEIIGSQERGYTAAINGSFVYIEGEQYNGATFLRGILEQWFGCTVWRFPDKPDYYCSYKSCYSATDHSLQDIDDVNRRFILWDAELVHEYKKPLRSIDSIENELDNGFENAINSEKQPIDP